VSHQPERNEKNCLNCGTTVLGRYCHVCGQENVEIKESFSTLLKHFVYDIFHFDTKFFDTLKYLLFRPGFVPKQYVEGKRSHYLHPIRMYLFTSAVFFLVLFYMRGANGGFITINAPSDSLTHKQRTELISDLKDELKDKPGDTTLSYTLNRLQDTAQPVRERDAAIAEGVPTNKPAFFDIGDSSIQRAEQYDSSQKALPVGTRDGWLKSAFIHKGLEINSKYHGDATEALKAFFELFAHKLAYLLFVSLPFFALILKLLYIRRRNFYYSDHAVFTLYHYIFTFILLLFVFLFNALHNWWHLGIFNYLMSGLLIAWAVHLLVAMRRFYGQGWGKTFSKFLLLNLLGNIVLLLLFVVFLFFTLFQL